MLELYVRVMNWLREQEEGQDLIEYAVLIAFIALVVWVAVTVAGGEISRVWTVISNKLGSIT